MRWTKTCVVIYNQDVHNSHTQVKSNTKSQHVFKTEKMSNQLQGIVLGITGYNCNVVVFWYSSAAIKKRCENLLILEKIKKKQKRKEVKYKLIKTTPLNYHLTYMYIE